MTLRRLPLGAALTGGLAAATGAAFFSSSPTFVLISAAYESTIGAVDELLIS